MRTIFLILVSLATVFWIYKSIAPQAPVEGNATAPAISKQAANGEPSSIANALKQPLDRTKAVLSEVRKQRDEDEKQF